MRLLVLGGTSEASALARRLAERGDFDATLSLAGRTAHPAVAPIPVRVGGFGGVEGLARYLRDHAIDAVIDATHPFAAQMSDHAVIACQRAGIPLAAFTRPAWTAIEGDRWIEVDSADEAVRALGEAARVFLTVGRLQLAAFAGLRAHVVLRTIDPPPPDVLPASAEVILARGPFSIADEVDLMRSRQIEVVVTKNSGGAATRAKIDAARDLGLPVVMFRPPRRGARAFFSLEQTMAWLDFHGQAP